MTWVDVAFSTGYAFMVYCIAFNGGMAPWEEEPVVLEEPIPFIAVEQPKLTARTWQWDAEMPRALIE